MVEQLVARRWRSRRGRGSVAGVAVFVLIATACSSGSPVPAVQTSLSVAPSAASAVTRPGGSACASQPPRTQGGGDVLVPGDIPDNQAYVVYRSAADAYHLSVPEGWARSQVGTTVTFRDKFNSIKVELVSAASAPSVASARAGDVAVLSTSTPCFVGGNVSQIARSAGAAVLIIYRADSPADPVTGKVVRQDVERYEFWQAGREAIITLASPQGSDNVDPWRKVTDSFIWGP